MEPTFKSLYHLENDTISVIEIERTDLPATAEIYERYQWLKFVKLTNELTPLLFVSMKADEEEQERTFEGAYLRFNNHEGTFREEGNAEQVLINNTANGVSKITGKQIAAYLKKEK
ncbi:hypothetical protein [Pedobacter punctiformis]|uniref:Uncharacterized protein n=1 Tax=Pedobacter punctiformis TaxID=3004097 RepID=A0ABT4L9T1_9SPHI|nr:hypothetical protein [Pedobacter sp. HCMS5-2]MCZ4243569.1 hypothetical protein [Pedobacter sp. HCMS5-2]